MENNKTEVIKNGNVTTVFITKKRKNYYLEPKVFAEEYQKSVDQGEPTIKLIKYFELIARKYNTVLSSIYTNKTDIDACVNYAVTEAWLKWDKYDPERSSNLFSFFTTMLSNDMKHHYNKIWKGRKRNISIEALFANNQEG